MNHSNSIHRLDAFRLLDDGGRHALKAWKLQNGEVIEAEGVRVKSRNVRGGYHKYLFTRSGSIRCIRDCLVFEVDGMTVYW